MLGPQGDGPLRVVRAESLRELIGRTAGDGLARGGAPRRRGARPARHRADRRGRRARPRDRAPLLDSPTSRRALGRAQRARAPGGEDRLARCSGRPRLQAEAPTQPRLPRDPRGQAGRGDPPEALGHRVRAARRGGPPAGGRPARRLRRARRAVRHPRRRQPDAPASRGRRGGRARRRATSSSTPACSSPTPAAARPARPALPRRGQARRAARRGARLRRRAAAAARPRAPRRTSSRSSGASSAAGRRPTVATSPTTRCAASSRPPASPSSSAPFSCSTPRAPATCRCRTHLPAAQHDPRSPSARRRSSTRPTRARPRCGATSPAWSRRCETGRSAWGVPPYNGALFSRRTASTVPRCSRRASIPDAPLAPALVALARDPDDPELGVDFSGLEIGHLGHIYEGLLSLRLSVADRDFATTRARDRYVAPTTRARREVQRGRADLADQRGRAQGRRRLLHAHGARAPPRPPVGAPGVRGAPRRRSASWPRRTRPRRPRSSSSSTSSTRPAAAPTSWSRWSTRLRTGSPSCSASWRCRPSATSWRPCAPRPGKAFGAEIEDAALLKRLVLKRCVFGVDLSPMGAEIAKVSLWLALLRPRPLARLPRPQHPGRQLADRRRAAGAMSPTGRGARARSRCSATSSARRSPQPRGRPPSCARSPTAPPTRSRASRDDGAGAAREGRGRAARARPLDRRAARARSGARDEALAARARRSSPAKTSQLVERGGELAARAARLALADRVRRGRSRASGPGSTWSSATRRGRR